MLQQTKQGPRNSTKQAKQSELDQRHISILDVHAYIIFGHTKI